MKKNTKILIYFFVLAIFGLAFFIGIIVKNRYYKKNQPENIPTETIAFPIKKITINSTQFTPTNTPSEIITPEDKKEDTIKNSSPEKESYLEIEKKDCENKCSDFKNEEDDFRYCQEVCGLIEIKNESSSEECEKMEELEKDYCLRDLAISKKDYKLCEKIEDENITQNCQNRITEDILEGQNK